MKLNKIYSFMVALCMISSMNGSVHVSSSFCSERMQYSFYVPVRNLVLLAVGAGIVAGATYQWYSWYPNNLQKWNKRYAWLKNTDLSLLLMEKQLNNDNEYELLKQFYANANYPLIDAVDTLEKGLAEVRHLLKHAYKLSCEDQASITGKLVALQHYEKTILENIVYIKMKQEYTMQKSILVQAQIAREIGMAALRYC